MAKNENYVSVLKDSQQAKVKESLSRLSKIAEVLDQIPGLIDGEDTAMGYSLIGKSYVDLNNEITAIRQALDK